MHAYTCTPSAHTSLMMSAALWYLCMSVHALVFTSASAMLRSRSLRNLGRVVITQRRQ